MATNRKICIVIASITCSVAFTRASFALDPDGNGIDGIPHNGLSTEAFRLNALTTNKTALEHLISEGLSGAQNDFYVLRQLKDPDARAMLHEIIRCALPGSETRKYDFVDANGTSRSVTWRGELGLCQAPDGDLTSPECQRFVTACVAARVNAIHKSIPISLRSVVSPLVVPPVDSSASAPIVRALELFRESTPGSDPAQGMPIASFDAGWQAAGIGTCAPGQDVSLKIAGAACSSAKLRVCAGIHGCVGTDGFPLPANFPTSGPAKYASVTRLGEKYACTGDLLQFTCPQGEGVAGYFSTMVKPDPGQSSGPYRVVSIEHDFLGQRVDVTVSTTEAEAFRFIEGAFYGNLFNPDQLERDCQVSDDGTELQCVKPASSDWGDSASCRRQLGSGGPVCSDGPGGPICSVDVPVVGAGSADGSGEPSCLDKNPSLPYAHIYACYSYDQQEDIDFEVDDPDHAGVAELNSRLCDLPPGAGADACFPHKLMRCHKKDGSGLCTAIDKGKGAYGECHAEERDSQGNDIISDTVYHRIVTTYLNEPCNVIGELLPPGDPPSPPNPVCTRLHKVLDSSGVPVIKARIAPRAPDFGDPGGGGGGCEIGGPGGAIWPVLVALGVRGWRRRRRPQAPAASQR